MFHVSDIGDEGHTTAEDKWYHPSNRKTAGSAKDRAKVAQLARCVDTGGDRLIFSPFSNLLQNIVTINGKKFDGPSEEDLAFNLEYLRRPSKSLKGRWCGLHWALVAVKNKCRKIIFLSSLLYAEGSDQDIFQTLMTLGNIPVFH
ncbi:hypothetical protein B0J15DRAFT_556239 [Fusarium solani]|uniref:Uncharacterized protein n=1 Tax=Fusarium solani TaxID=169388 RepID=A0A9P9JM13_FUSSL|nr:uncharacterized protein B0J15DRAFT_556239 [Fusarium solani]KAH7228624.1 hypothetical protein B0J15DRAFT_556239 [Fusarium solani]